MEHCKSRPLQIYVALDALDYIVHDAPSTEEHFRQPHPTKGDVYNDPIIKLDIDDPRFCGRSDVKKVNLMV